MNFKDIIGPDELDWKVIPLDWEKIGKDELKLGTPMSRDGVEANDASCYGILMDDVEKSKHFQARVIVSGCVDFAKAEEYSGIKISEEAKNAIGKVWSQDGDSGPIDPKRLPEGYPYKESFTIEWDGNTEGRVCIDGMCKVSDLIPADLAGAKVWIAAPDGNIVSNDVLGNAQVGIQGVYIYSTQGNSMPAVAVVTEENTDFETGVYFQNDVLYCCKLSTETIHPMAEEFLPGPLVLYVMEV